MHLVSLSNSGKERVNFQMALLRKSQRCLVFVAGWLLRRVSLMGAEGSWFRSDAM